MMSAVRRSDDHWFTLVIATGVVVILYGVFSVPWYWALVVGMIVSGITEFAIKEVPPDPTEYDPSHYQLWDMAVGDSRRRSAGSIGNSDTQASDSLETLRDRYARGELTDEQFEQKVQKLLESESLDEAEDREEAREILTEGTD